MKMVYLGNLNKNLLRFVCEIKDDGCESFAFTDVAVVSEKAFASSDMKQVVFEDTLATIKKEAFKDCEELRVFCCGKLSSETKIEKETESNEKDEKNNVLAESIIKGLGIYDASSDFVVETSAFAGCEKLHTVILPKCKTLKIEKGAFAECSSLRTVIALSDKIEFTENPFGDCLKDLTFICNSGSGVERFSRENGYRYVNV